MEAPIEYQRLDFLGGGAFGIVYKALNKTDGTLIALKEITLVTDGVNNSKVTKQKRKTIEITTK